MPVKAITQEYRFPSRSRQELYGEDLLVHVMWQGNPFFAAPATFRVPTMMPFGTLITKVVLPWVALDPDFVPGSLRDWTLDGKPLAVREHATLQDLGVGHKSLLGFQTRQDLSKGRIL